MLLVCPSPLPPTPFCCSAGLSGVKDTSIALLLLVTPVAGPASRVLKTRASLYCCWLLLLQDRPLGWVASFPLPYLAAGTTRVLTDGRTQTPESCTDSIWSYIAKEGVTFAHLTPQVAGYSGGSDSGEGVG